MGVLPASNTMSDANNIKKPTAKQAPFISILDKLELDLNNWDRKLSNTELEYMFDRFTHIQIATPNKPSLPSHNPPKIVTSRSGWAILNYGNAIASSPGKYLFNYAGLPQYNDMVKSGMIKKKDDEDEGGTDIGTLGKQRFITAEDIISEALENGWESIHIVDGDPNFIWAIWALAEENGLGVTGYDFSKSDMERRDRANRSQLDDQLSKKGMKNR
jgi:hypothetical protein